jgi:hypothetical protein
MDLFDIIFGLVIVAITLFMLKELRLPSSFFKREDTRRVQKYIDQREKLMVDQLVNRKEEE